MRGQPETANGFTINSSNAEEEINMGTVIVPNFDSIREGHVLTSHFDTQCSKDSGGQVAVVTKSGDNRFHGDGFEFLCNMKPGAHSFFWPGRAIFGRNPLGGTLRVPAFGKIVSAQPPRPAHLRIKVLF